VSSERHLTLEEMRKEIEATFAPRHMEDDLAGLSPEEREKKVREFFQERHKKEKADEEEEGGMKEPPRSQIPEEEAKKNPKLEHVRRVL